MGEEESNDLEMNNIAFQWREYDPAIARFNRIDRFAEQYLSISTYSFTANNPILYREIAGDSIGKGKEHFERIKETARSEKQSILDTRAKKLKNAEGNDKRTAKLNEKYARQDSNSSSRINRLDQALSEFDALESSDVVFNLITNSPDVDSNTANGNIQYDTSSGEININVAGGFNAGYFGHELKHGFQFLEGKLSFYKSSGNGGFLYDVQDEVEAFKRQSLFGGEGRGEIDIRLSPSYRGIRDRTTQRSLDSKVHPSGSATFRQQFPRHEGTANEQIYIKN